MTVYKVTYYTLSKGKDPNGDIGNVKQFDSIAYIECSSSSRVESLLEKHYTKSVKKIYYYPVIRSIVQVGGHCIIEDE